MLLMLKQWVGGLSISLWEEREKTRAIRELWIMLASTESSSIWTGVLYSIDCFVAAVAISNERPAFYGLLRRLGLYEEKVSVLV